MFIHKNKDVEDYKDNHNKLCEININESPEKKDESAIKNNILNIFSREMYNDCGDTPTPI